ncbi:MAG: hypothetical protein ACP5D7_15835 [Limnospira sp.]
MFQKIWQWLKNFFAGLFGRHSETEPSPEGRATESRPAPAPLSDAGYETFLMQLLDGVAGGWGRSQLSEALGNRDRDRHFISWLQRFGRKSCESPLPQQELARRMAKLGEIESGEIGAIAREIGQNLQQKESRSLTETQREELFQYLLNQVNLGWDTSRIRQFFDELGEQGNPQLWMGWLQGYGEQLLAAPNPNYKLTPALQMLAERTTASDSLRDLGAIAATLAARLLAREEREAVWEYDGPDIPPAQPETSGSEGGVTVSLEELLRQLQQNPALVRQLAEQLGLEATEDPEAIVRALEKQFSQPSEFNVDYR